MNAFINWHDEEEIQRSGMYQRYTTAMAGGYIGRKSGDGYIESYAGRYGVGLKVHRPNSKSNNFHEVVYYIEIE